MHIVASAYFEHPFQMLVGHLIAITLLRIHLQPRQRSIDVVCVCTAASQIVTNTVRIPFCLQARSWQRAVLKLFLHIHDHSIPCPDPTCKHDLSFKHIMHLKDFVCLIRTFKTVIPIYQSKLFSAAFVPHPTAGLPQGHNRPAAYPSGRTYRSTSSA